MTVSPVSVLTSLPCTLWVHLRSAGEQRLWRYYELSYACWRCIPFRFVTRSFLWEVLFYNVIEHFWKHFKGLQWSAVHNMLKHAHRITTHSCFGLTYSPLFLPEKWAEFIHNWYTPRCIDCLDFSSSSLVDFSVHYFLLALPPLPFIPMRLLPLVLLVYNT